MKLLQVFSLPLLTKELIEQAQNKRTYVLRVIYAVALYGLALLQYQLISGDGVAGVMNMGGGRRLFDNLVMLQSAMIFLLIPPITCGALTIEKEKDTLALLLLTKLSPLTIVFEKMLSRVFTMATYQLLSLPLFAIIYGIGGVDLGDIIVAIAGLASLTFLVASISILCSTWFRTTSSAFVWTYILLCLLSFGFFSISASALFLFGRFVQRQFFSSIRPMTVPSVGLAGDLIRTFFSTVFFFVTVPPLLLSLFTLLIAARVLVRRAFLPMRNLVLEAFQLADRFFTELNRVTTGGIVLVSDKDPLPFYDAITWRETRKKSLGTFRYQFRILMLLMAPLMLAMAAVMADGRVNFEGPVPGFLGFFWIVSVICITIHATGVVPSERIRQTLDVLLVMPLSPRDIVLEKLAGVRRLIMILLVPFATLLAFQATWNGYIAVSSSLIDRNKAILKLATMVLSSVTYMHLIMWLGLQLGLRMRTQMQAVLSTFALIGAACAVPVLIGQLLYPMLMFLLLNDSDVRLPEFNFFLNESELFFESFSPLMMVFGSNDLIDGGRYLRMTNPSFSPQLFIAWVIFIFHFSFYGFLVWKLRKNALQQFSRIVGRTEPESDISKPANPAEAFEAAP